jgi:hypothetical protein
LQTLIPGQNGDDGSQDILDIKSSPPGTPQSKTSSSTGEEGQASGCGQTGGSSGGGGVCGGNKMMAIRVQMLDDSITLFQVQVKRLKMPIVNALKEILLLSDFRYRLINIFSNFMFSQKH